MSNERNEQSIMPGKCLACMRTKGKADNTKRTLYNLQLLKKVISYCNVGFIFILGNMLF